MSSQAEIQEAVDALADVAAKDERFTAALGNLVPAFFTAGIEARMWCNHVGEIVLASQSMSAAVAEYEGKGVAQIKSKDTVPGLPLVFVLELTNGSAIVLGLKCHEQEYLKHIGGAK